MSNRRMKLLALEGEVTIETSDDAGSSGVFQLLLDESSAEQPPVSGSWRCESGG